MGLAGGSKTMGKRKRERKQIQMKAEIYLLPSTALTGEYGPALVRWNKVWRR